MSDQMEGEDIPASNGQGWDWFNQTQEKAMKEARARLEMEQQEIDRAFARVANTPDGQLVLKTLASWVDATEDFDPTLGFYNGAAFGFWRTGQKHLVKFIKNAIVRGGKA